MVNRSSQMIATFSALMSLLFFQIAVAADTLFPGQSLTGNQTLTSKGGSFILGFFQPGKSPRFYIGVWYNISQQTVVWVANREAPVPSPRSSELKVDRDGSLVLISASKVVWSSNSTASNPNTFAVLEDSGNLVLKQSSGPQVVIWQSFDDLTDTWLPGALIGRNKVTGEIRKLVSWKSPEDPARGPFSLSIDPEGSTQYVLRWNDSVNYWESGRWNGQYFEGMSEMDPRIYNQLPETLRTYMYNYTFIDDNQWRAFYFTANLSRPFIPRTVVDSFGQVRQWNWMDNSRWVLFWSQPRRQCDVYALCGPFGVCDEKAIPHCLCLTGFGRKSVSNWSADDWTAGCSRRMTLQCDGKEQTAGQQDKFKPLFNMTLPENPQNLEVKSTEECQFVCANNCSCTAYAYNNAGCSVWVGNLLNLQNMVDGDGVGQTLYLRVAAAQMTEKNHKKKSKIIIGIAAAFTGILFSVFVGLWWWRKKRMVKITTKGPHNGSLVVFPYHYLQSATKNFSEVVGIGGFGTVFKGVLSDSTPIAVKKIEDIGHGEKQFRAEVSTLATVRHVNLIHFQGFCSKGPHRMLVYDFMPNGSLSSHLFNRNSKSLNWKMRYQILLGVARGLAYLHEQCRECIVHCDIKPENILLDMDFCPKVSDFGLAKLIGRDFSRALTTMRGTIGYLAPEWISGLPITSKADVYSYGMMLFEVLSGKRNAQQGGESMVFYPAWAATKVNEHQLHLLLDRKLEEDVDADELKRACRVACWCIQEDESNRPSMGMVVQILEGVVDIEMPPVPRLLQHLSKEQKTFFFSELSSNARNSETMDAI